MKKIIQGTAIAAGLIIFAGSTVGCSMIGYALGGAGNSTKSVLDSVSVRMEVDSAGLEHRSWDIERLALLANEARPGEGSMVEILTQDGSLKGDALTLDTLLAVKGESADSASEWLLPGEMVTLTTKVSQVKGEVVRLSERNIILRVDGEEHGYARSWVRTILLSNGRTLSDSGLTSSNFAGRLIRVPGIFLGQGSLPFFIPLRHMDRVYVKRWIVSGPARTVFFAVGAALDVLFIGNVIKHGIF